ncbi:unnamed protein product [Closterium sp. NIES-54]
MDYDTLTAPLASACAMVLACLSYNLSLSLPFHAYIPFLSFSLTNPTSHAALLASTIPFCLIYSPFHHSPANVVTDVADITISLYSSLNLTVAQPPYVFRLKPFRCVTIPEEVFKSVKSVGVLYRAPGTYMRCDGIRAYLQPKCSGDSALFDVPPGNDIAKEVNE